MHIRTATTEDKPAIIKLLKESLGESTIPKSEALWSWKHEENPFGISHVLLAEEKNKLIGLRAFMRWEWQWNGDLYSAIRAVDTATHPGHQGKGIFKKLTLQQASICKQQGTHFVFNTPNEQSRPGYIKMGWVEQGKMPLKLKLLNPFSVAYAKVVNKKRCYNLESDPTPLQEWKEEVIELVKNPIQQKFSLSTRLTSEYISWRYVHNPLFRYFYFTDNDHYLIITRIKNYHFAKELRIVEFILLQPKADPKTIKQRIKKEILQFCKSQKVDMLSLSGQQYQHFKSYLDWMGMIPVKPLGPLITLKDLNMNNKFSELLKKESWNYSLGDMELF